MSRAEREDAEVAKQLDAHSEVDLLHALAWLRDYETERGMPRNMARQPLRPKIDIGTPSASFGMTRVHVCTGKEVQEALERKWRAA